MLLGLGAVARLLALIGVYGIVSAVVGSRTREIGVRMALGAARRRIRTSTLASGVRVALVGAVLGLGVAFAVARLIRGYLPSADGIGATAVSETGRRREAARART